MSAEFSNAYQEILLDNLVSVVKQNFMFQTQLKLAEKVSLEKKQLQEQYEELVAIVKQQIENGQLDILKTNFQQTTFTNEEKARLQNALNQEMKTNASLVQENSILKNNNATLERYLSEFREENTKLKAELASLQENSDNLDS